MCDPSPALLVQMIQANDRATSGMVGAVMLALMLATLVRLLRRVITSHNARE